MAVRIRLLRMGKIRNPQYRIVVADSRTKRDGRVIEEIGTYNPKTEPSTINVVSERAQYWLSVGAQPTALVKPSRPGESVSSRTSQPCAVVCIHDPSVPMNAPTMNRR